MDTDWTELDDGLGPGGTAETRFAITYGIARPPSDITNNFLAGFNSTTTTRGAAAWYANQANFAPTPANKGGSVRGAIQRAASEDDTGFAPFFYFLGGQTEDSVNDDAYILGLTDENPHRIALVKGKPSDGVPASGDPSILRISEDTFNPETWHHLRLDVTVNLTGDVLLDAFSNDLSAQKIGSAPDWQAIAGMAQFVDDALGINSGSLPFTRGRMGFGFFSENVSRRGIFDHCEILRQT